MKSNQNSRNTTSARTLEEWVNKMPIGKGFPLTLDLDVAETVGYLVQVALRRGVPMAKVVEHYRELVEDAATTIAIELGNAAAKPIEGLDVPEAKAP